MASKYREYLLKTVINDENVVTYRSLSRALKVPSNTAKKMLYHFHQSQNEVKPKTVHACYLVSGNPKQAATSSTKVNGSIPKSQEDDSLMHDLSFVNSSMPEPSNDEEQESTRILSIVLVAEEKLSDVRDSFDHISSIHVYSIEPGPLRNIESLSDCNRKILIEYAKDDLLETWKDYGTIHNPFAVRRQLRRPTTNQAPALPTTTSSKPTTTTTAATGPVQHKPETKGSTKPPGPMKRESSNIFSSFAKAATHTAQKEARASGSKLESDSEDEADGEDVKALELSSEDKAKAEANRKERLERTEKLRRLMDDPEDETTGDKDEAKEDMPESEEEMEDVEADDEDAGASAALDAPNVPPSTTNIKADEQTSNVVVSNGRRRGRRKVIKSRTMRDAEGFFVTKEEPEWESFSEDDGPPSHLRKENLLSQSKKPAGSATSTAGAGKKAGQGNIMSFFQKR